MTVKTTTKPADSGAPKKQPKTAQADKVEEQEAPTYTHTELELVGAKTYAVIGCQHVFQKNKPVIMPVRIADRIRDARHPSNKRKLFRIRRDIEGDSHHEEQVGDYKTYDDAELDDVVRTIQSLSDDKINWTADGKPQTSALTDLMGRVISANERDQAWELLQERTGGDLEDEDDDDGEEDGSTGVVTV